MSNWHWEETNYTRWFSHRLDRVLSNYRFVSHTTEIELVSPIIQGEASILLRQGKPVASCCFNATADWSAIHVPDLKIAKGQIKLRDIDVESLQDPISTEVTCLVDDNLHQLIRQILVKEVVDEITELIRTNVLTPFLQEETVTVLLAQQQKLEEKTQENNKATSAIGVETAKFQMSSFQGGKLATASALTTVVSKSTDKSEINETTTESYQTLSEPKTFEKPRETFYWEEKNLTSSTISEIEKRLSSIKDDNRIRCLNGECQLELFDIKVRGEAARSLRRGKRLTIYDFDIECSWRGTTRTSSGVFMADAKGQLRIENMNSEDVDDLSMIFECDDKKHPARQRIFDSVKTEGAKALEQIIRKSVERHLYS